jgi:hypothetical protein
VKFSNAASTNGSTIGVNTLNDFVLANQDITNDIGFNTGGSRKMTISSNGYVGIGTATPSSTLHVNGTGKFTDVLELAPSGIKLNGNTYSSALIDASLSIPKLPESSVSNKTLDGNFKTLKVMDTAVDHGRLRKTGFFESGRQDPGR